MFWASDNIYISCGTVYTVRMIFLKGIAMKNIYFSPAPPVRGKTTLIRRALGDKIAYAGGFITERRLAANDSLLGFDLLPLPPRSRRTNTRASAFLITQ